MKRDLMHAVPPVPERYLSKMDDALKEISDMEHMKKHRHSYGALAVALALVIALAGLAYAAATQSGILGRLFPESTPTPVVEEAIVRSPASDSAEGVTLTIDEYLYDSNTLNVDWTVTSERDEPVYYLLDYWTDYDELVVSDRSSGGGSGESSVPTDPHNGEFVVLDGANGKPGVGRSRSDYYKTSNWGGHVDQPFQVRIRAHVFTSPLQPVLLSPDEAIHIHESDNPVHQRLAGAKQLGVAWGITSVDAYPAIRAALDRLYPLSDAIVRNDPNYEQDRSLRPESLGETGLMTPIATLTASVTIDPTGSADFWHTEPVQRSFTYSLGRIEIETLDVGASATRMSYREYPNRSVNEAFETGCRGVLLDPDGNLIGFTNGMGSSSEDDYVTLTIDANPQPSPPEYVYLIPGLKGDDFIDDFYQEGKIPEGERFRIDLKITP